MRILLSFLAVLSSGLPGLVHAQVPVGGEFQVNTSTAEYQSDSSVAMDAAGRFVVVWLDGYIRWDEYWPWGTWISRGIFGRRYDSSGNALGGEFEVDAYTSSRPLRPAVGADAEGNFVVAWQASADPRSPGSTSSVFARRFGADGMASGGSFPVSTSVPARIPALASAPDGDFAVVWAGGDVQLRSHINGRLFDASGAPLGGEFQVNATTSHGVYDPAVARDAAGNFVVAWSRSDYAVFARRYDAAGTPLGPQFLVNTYTTGRHTRPALAMKGDGRFVIVWRAERPGTSGAAVLGQLYDTAGAALGGEFQVSSYGEGRRVLASAMDDDGSFVVAWDNFTLRRTSEVFLRRFDASAAPVSAEIRVNTYTPDDQEGPEVATNGRGNFVVTWTSHYQDGSRTGVFGQRFGPDQIFADGFE